MSGLSVLHLIAPGPIAGAEKVVLGGAAAQADLGLDVLLGVLGDTRCPEHGETFARTARDAGVRTELLVTRGRIDPRALWRLSRLAGSRGWRALHTHGYKALTYGLLAAPRGRPPVVAHHHGTTEHDARVRTYERLAVLLCRAPAVARVLAPGDAMASRLSSAGVPRRLIEVVSNFVSLPEVPARQPRGAVPRVLVLGRVSVEKGLDTLLTALDRSPSLELEVTIVGDGPERERLETRSAGDGRVHWVGYQADVRAYLGAADLLVLPSRREGLPMTVLEAAACGVPIIASDVGSVADIVRDTDNGRLVAADDPAALAAALAEVTTDLARFTAAAMRLAPDVRERFSARRWAEETQAVYASLPGGSP